MPLDPLNVLAAVVVVSIFGALSYKTKIVDTSGLIAGFVVGLSVFIFGGWKWFVTILAFHLIAGAFTKYKYEVKRRLGVAERKGGARSWKNVLANGGVAMCFAVIEFALPYDLFFAGFLGAVATACADTLATEIGMLSKSYPRLITNLKRRVPPGSSGGITLLGELAILFAGFVIATITYLVGAISWPLWKLYAVVIGACFIGSTIDSVLGATVQAQFRCAKCNKITEWSHHCGVPAIHISGCRSIDNHVVNFLATFSGGLTAILLLLAL